MCGRFTAPFSGAELKARYKLKKTVKDFQPTYNASPGMMLPVITKNSPLSATLMKWGFIPVWEKDFTKAKFKPFNARDDKLDSGFFRQAFTSTRCLIPCSGYYEWKKFNLDGKEIKQPYYFSLKDEKIFSLGGLYSIHTDAGGVKHYFYTIITTPPNSLQKPIHDRMPVIIPQNKEEEWLQTDKPMGFVKPFESKQMNVWKVATLVSSFKNDGPDLIKAV